MTGLSSDKKEQIMSRNQSQIVLKSRDLLESVTPGRKLKEKQK